VKFWFLALTCVNKSTAQFQSLADDFFMCRCTKDIVFHVHKSMLFLFQADSLDLAMKLLDGYEHRGYKLYVERTKFQMKGNFDPSLKPKKQKKKEKERLKKMQEK